MPHEKHGTLTEQSDLPDSVYAFPKPRKEPLTDEKHVRNAVARFDQVIDVSDADRALAFANIEKAARYYASTFPRRTGMNSAFIRNVTARRPPPNASRPAAGAEKERPRNRLSRLLKKSPA
jgi:hypothetical protein